MFQTNINVWYETWWSFWHLESKQACCTLWKYETTWYIWNLESNARVSSLRKTVAGIFWNLESEHMSQLRKPYTCRLDERSILGNREVWTTGRIDWFPVGSLWRVGSPEVPSCVKWISKSIGKYMCGNPACIICAWWRLWSKSLPRGCGEFMAWKGRTSPNTPPPGSPRTV
jgi:hypothetical protein